MTLKSDIEAGHGKRMAGAFFGRKKTNPLKRSQIRLFETLFPRLNLDISKPAPADIHQLFDMKVDKVVLEIGFGGGEHLVERAKEQPNTGFIGCEPFINGMGKVLSAISDNQLENIRVFDEDATWLLDWLPANSIDLIYLLYPDPWPKKRHWKRRFVNPANLNRFSKVLKAGCEFRFASDIEHYVNWTLRHCARSGILEWQARSCDDWIKPWEGWQSTRYERKAFREGRTPAYLTFDNLGKLKA